MTGSASLPTGRLADKVAIVTGSSSGIGRAIAVAYLREGAKVVCADIKPDAPHEVNNANTATTLELLQRNDGAEKAIFIRTDVSSSKDIEALVGETVKRFGKLDIMVNNAGVVPLPEIIHETSEESWDKTMSINARSVFLGSKYAIAQMLKQEPHSNGDRGWIINNASVSALVGIPGAPSYCASKGAIVQLTKQVAIDYAKHRIHSNAICPGYTQTPRLDLAYERMGNQLDAVASLHPFGGFGKAEDVAQVAVFLASSDAQWITGVALPVDGGFTAQ